MNSHLVHELDVRSATVRGNRKEWLCGYLKAVVERTASSLHLTLNTSVAFEDATIAIRLLDGNQQEVEDEDGQPITLLAAELKLSGPTSIPFCLDNLRPIELFGPQRKFSTGSVSVDIPKLLWKQTRYVVVTIRPKTLAEKSAASGDRTQNSGECICLEMSCKKLITARKSALFLLISKTQAAKRMKRILEKHPVLCGKNRVARSAAPNVHIKLFRGGDTPLLTEKI